MNKEPCRLCPLGLFCYGASYAFDITFCHECSCVTLYRCRLRHGVGVNWLIPDGTELVDMLENQGYQNGKRNMPGHYVGHVAAKRDTPLPDNEVSRLIRRLETTIPSNCPCATRTLDDTGPLHHELYPCYKK